MLNRRQIRELALQALFSMDMKKEFTFEMAISFLNSFYKKNPMLDFYEKIIGSVIDNKEEIDIFIQKVSKNWKINRMPFVDRNIIRIASAEILYMDDIPTTVSINEAIDIAKKFGTKKSSSFVNGILDKIHIESSRL